jgi:FMN phosphatase YigB (HAD superfamily)
MIYWIFDMDNTLYQRDENNTGLVYNSLKRDSELIYLLKKLEGMKILLTDGTHQHTNLVLDKMDLTSSFDLILDRNILDITNPISGSNVLDLAVILENYEAFRTKRKIVWF